MFDLRIRIARSLYSFHEIERELRVQKLFDVLNLEFSVAIWSNLDYQSRFIDKWYANGRVCVIGGLEGTSGEWMESKRIVTDMNEHLPGHLGHRVDVNLRG